VPHPPPSQAAAAAWRCPAPDSRALFPPSAPPHAPRRRGLVRCCSPLHPSIHPYWRFPPRRRRRHYWRGGCAGWGARSGAAAGPVAHHEHLSDCWGHEPCCLHCNFAAQDEDVAQLCWYVGVLDVGRGGGGAAGPHVVRARASVRRSVWLAGGRGVVADKQFVCWLPAAGAASSFVARVEGGGGAAEPSIDSAGRVCSRCFSSLLHVFLLTLCPSAILAASEPVLCAATTPLPDRRFLEDAGALCPGLFDPLR